MTLKIGFSALKRTATMCFYYRNLFIRCSKQAWEHTRHGCLQLLRSGLDELDAPVFYPKIEIFLSSFFWNKYKNWCCFLYEPHLQVAVWVWEMIENEIEVSSPSEYSHVEISTGLEVISKFSWGHALFCPRKAKNSIFITFLGKWHSKWDLAR